LHVGVGHGISLAKTSIRGGGSALTLADDYMNGR
jgi:hypothetical protein